MSKDGSGGQVNRLNDFADVDFKVAGLNFKIRAYSTDLARIKYSSGKRVSDEKKIPMVTHMGSDVQKGGGIMASSSKKASACCSMEKQRLMKELEKCNFCTDSYEEFHSCYRLAARESGQRSRACLVG